MGLYYFDTSAIVKYFHREVGSTWVREIVLAQNEQLEKLNRVYIGNITIAEAPAAFSILERNHQIDRSARDALYREFVNSIESQFLLAESDIASLYRAATLTQKYPLKGYDAVQLAIALDFYELSLTQDLDLIFVTSDTQLLRAAQAEGMSIENPHTHSNPSPQ